jgi:hypothetical protein
MPKDLGELGILNLRVMNLALKARWLWLRKMDASKMWKEFNIQVPEVCIGFLTQVLPPLSEMGPPPSS